MSPELLKAYRQGAEDMKKLCIETCTEVSDRVKLRNAARWNPLHEGKSEGAGDCARALWKLQAETLTPEGT
jgi:hypothetical protein